MKIEKDDPKLFEQNINSDLSLNYIDDDKYLENLNYLFEFLVIKLDNIYQVSRISNNITSQSIFLKLNSTYETIIIPNFENRLQDKYDSEKILDSIRIFEDHKKMKA